MALIELAIAACDAPEGHRVNEGDVVAVRPHPWTWGRKELDEYLIVIVEDPRPWFELDALIRKELLETGEDPDDVDAEIQQQQEARFEYVKTQFNIRASQALKDIANKKQHTELERGQLSYFFDDVLSPLADTEGYVVRERPKKAAKYRFRIDLEDIKKLLPELDLEKVRDKTKIYQPFKSRQQIVGAFRNDNGIFKTKSGQEVGALSDIDTGGQVNLENALVQTDFKKVFQEKYHLKPTEKVKKL